MAAIMKSNGVMTIYHGEEESEIAYEERKW